MCFIHIHTNKGEIIMGNSTKSGYELRTELLGMAIGILEHRVQRQFENEHLKPEGNREPVNPYVTEDVLIVAEKLMGFINRK